MTNELDQRYSKLSFLLASIIGKVWVHEIHLGFSSINPKKSRIFSEGRHSGAGQFSLEYLPATLPRVKWSAPDKLAVHPVN
jgi:hypothetical protein